MKSRIRMGIPVVAMAAAGLVSLSCSTAQDVVAIDPDDIGGVVAGPNGPEAGVWVIAETTQLPTKFARIVVTDDRGRYVLPDLPRATYDVFVRGYGLVDSPRVPATLGERLDLHAVIAPGEQSAAQVYPAAWWMAMLQLPDGANEQEKFQQGARGCLDCHEIGNLATRTIDPAITKQSSSSLDAWDRRTRVGPVGGGMGSGFLRMGEPRKAFADWTDRIANGAAPAVAPPRPTGLERNLVVTLWDWGSPIDGRADNVASGRRHPRLNANGPIYGVSQATDALNVLDPNQHSATIIKVPSNAPITETPNPSPTWGPDMWRRQADPRSVEIDSKGRTWLTLRTRDANEQPSWCGGTGANQYGKYYPLTRGDRQVAIYDPNTKEFEYIDTCFHSDHNESLNNVNYYGMGGSIGWIDEGVWEETHDAEKSQGWCPTVIDTNGDGTITEGWTEPDQPIDPAKDHRVSMGCYAIGINDKDGSIWCSPNQSDAKELLRLERGSNPPQTCKAEVYRPPTGQVPELVGTGSLTVSRDGIVYSGWRVSGHFTSFDRSKCKSTRDPEASGQSCPEGWTIYRNAAEPTYSNSSYKASESYLAHMDSEGVLGLGVDSPMYASVNTSSMEVFSSTRKEFVTLRVPYPLGFFARSATIRIDDDRGWKGKGLWSSYAGYASWHIEGGKGTRPKVVKFQMRPDPLAK